MPGNFEKENEGAEKKYTGRAKELLATFHASQRIPGAWEAWRGYRGQVTDYILENSQRGTSLAVFGAGRLNDLSLPQLLEHFSKVTLFDLDEAAMWEAVWRDGDFGGGNFLNRQPAIFGQRFSEWNEGGGAGFPQGKGCRELQKGQKKFGGKEERGRLEGTSEILPGLHIFPVDFVGITEEDYIAFAEALFSFAEALIDVGEGQDFYGAVHAVEKQLARMYEKSRAYLPRLPEEAYDYTVALGIHSQLGNTPAWLLSAVEAQMWEGEEAGCEKEPCHKRQGAGCEKEPCNKKQSISCEREMCSKKQSASCEREICNKKQGISCEKESCHKKTQVPNAELWQKERTALLARMEQESAFLSSRLNEIILSATKQKAFIGCEVSRAVREGEEWYAVPDSAVSGAWQAIEDIRRRAACGSVRFENYLDIVWPFFPAQGKAYRMMVMEIEGKK